MCDHCGSVIYINGKKIKCGCNGSLHRKEIELDIVDEEKLENGVCAFLGGVILLAIIAFSVNMIVWIIEAICKGVIYIKLVTTGTTALSNLAETLAKNIDKL